MWMLYGWSVKVNCGVVCGNICGDTVVICDDGVWVLCGIMWWVCVDVVDMLRDLCLGECVMGCIGRYWECLYCIYVKCKNCSQYSNKKMYKNPPDLPASHPWYSLRDDLSTFLLCLFTTMSWGVIRGRVSRSGAQYYWSVCVKEFGGCVV